MAEASTPPIPVAVEECHRVLAWLVPQLDHFPRSRRYTLGDKLERVLLDVLEALLEATYSGGSQIEWHGKLASAAR